MVWVEVDTGVEIVTARGRTGPQMETVNEHRHGDRQRWLSSRGKFRIFTICIREHDVFHYGNRKVATRTALGHRKTLPSNQKMIECYVRRQARIVEY